MMLVAPSKEERCWQSLPWQQLLQRWGLLCKREGAPAHAGTPQLLRQAAASSEGRKEKCMKRIKEKPKNIMQDTRQAVKRAVASADAWQGDLEEHRLSAGAGGKQKQARPDEP